MKQVDLRSLQILAYVRTYMHKGKTITVHCLTANKMVSIVNHSKFTKSLFLYFINFAFSSSIYHFGAISVCCHRITV